MHNLINVYMWYEGKLFDNIKLYPPIDKEILVNTIMDECGEMIPVTGHFQFFQMKIENFFARHYDTFKRLWDAYAADYAILENYDRMGTYSDTGTRSHSSEDVEHGTINVVDKGSSSTDENINVNRALDKTNNDKIDEDEETKVSAYDSDGYQPSNKRILDKTDNVTIDEDEVTSTVDSTDVTTHGTSDTSTIKTDSATFDESTSGEHTERIHGNVGVTTSQQMLLSELRLRNFNNFYNDVARIFMKELMVAMAAYRD